MFAPQAISGNSPMPSKPRLSSNPKLRNPDLQANQGSGSHIFLSTLPLSFFGRKELHACKMIIVIAHTITLIANTTPWSSIQNTREKGREAPRNKGEGGCHSTPCPSKPFYWGSTPISSPLCDPATLSSSEKEE